MKEKQEKSNHKKIKNFNVMIIITFLVGVLLMFSTYAWFYASLNVKIKFFNMVVSNNSGLSISFDGITFGNTVQISEQNLIEKLKYTYPNNMSQWAAIGLTPVSTNGIATPNDSKFDMYAVSNFGYKDKAKQKRHISTKRMEEKSPNSLNYYIAFDLFLKNITGSPISDNLFLDNGTDVKMESNSSEEMKALVNSMRFGFIKIGSVPLDSDAETVQNIQCNNNCEMVIYEPNSTAHNELSREKASNYNVDLFDGMYYPTYAAINEAKRVPLTDTISGKDTTNFSLQINRIDFGKPLFQIPDGITKVRVYVWIEGQDIDSLESFSDGADISIIINLIKDTAGYDYYN